MVLELNGETLVNITGLQALDRPIPAEIDFDVRGRRGLAWKWLDMLVEPVEVVTHQLWLKFMADDHKAMGQY